MMLLVCFDLPRNNKECRKQANQYRKRLIELGFTMKQFSLYEREIRKSSTRKKVVAILREELPDAGSITLYLLPNEVNDRQITILGKNASKTTVRIPQFIVV